MSDSLQCSILYPKVSDSKKFIHTILDILRSQSYNVTNPESNKINCFLDNYGKFETFDSLDDAVNAMLSSKGNGKSIEVWIQKGYGLSVSFENNSALKALGTNYRDCTLVGLGASSPYFKLNREGKRFMPGFQKLLEVLINETNPLFAWVLSDYLTEEIIKSTFQKELEKEDPPPFGWLTYYDNKISKKTNLKGFFAVKKLKNGVLYQLKENLWDVQPKDLKQINKIK